MENQKMDKEPRIYAQSVGSVDADAATLNCRFNDVARMIEAGKTLIDIRANRFNGDLKAFRKWVRQHMDKDEKSCFRYMIMAHDELFLKAGHIIKLADAYHLLDLDGSIEPERVPNTYTVN
jgi:hypothetical protein